MRLQIYKNSFTSKDAKLIYENPDQSKSVLEVDTVFTLEGVKYRVDSIFKQLTHSDFSAELLIDLIQVFVYEEI